jgi:hypothetical protein
LQSIHVALAAAELHDEHVKRGLGAAFAAAVGLGTVSWLLAVGCDQSSMDEGNVTPAGTVSCALTEPTPSGSETLFCVETLGYTVNQANADQEPCEGEPRDAGSWTFAYDACPREGALGGCRLTTDVTQQIETTQWYYAGGLHLRSGGEARDAEAVMPPCLSNYTFIGP